MAVWLLLSLTLSKTLHSLNLALKMHAASVSCILQNYLSWFLLAAEYASYLNIYSRHKSKFFLWSWTKGWSGTSALKYWLRKQSPSVTGYYLSFKNLLRQSTQAEGSNSRAFVMYSFLFFSFLLAYFFFFLNLLIYFNFSTHTCLELSLVTSNINKCWSIFSCMFEIVPLKCYILSAIKHGNLFRNAYSILFGNTIWICSIS